MHTYLAISDMPNKYLITFSHLFFSAVGAVAVGEFLYVCGGFDGTFLKKLSPHN